MYTAREVFTTGTMGELTPVLEIDGRRIGDGNPGTLTRRLSRLYAEWVRQNGDPLPF
jgi:branched-subunit amino acid aminotransferase/4-amino-4-deoxychorismate lyase